jgi:hypothetical protein
LHYSAAHGHHEVYSSKFNAPWFLYGFFTQFVSTHHIFCVFALM